MCGRTSKFKAFILLISGLLLLNNPVISATQVLNKSDANKVQGESEKAFNPGKVIFEHVGDSYEWHITSFKDLEIAIPLPVILYSKYSGFHFFFSYWLYHGSGMYLGFHVAQEGPNKSKIVEVLPDGKEVKPIDISITKDVLSLFISLGLMLWIFISIARRYAKHPNRAPKGMQSLLEPVILFVRDEIGLPAIGKDRYEKYMPYLLTVFFFIFLNNLLGLVPIFPGGANLTGNITVTAILALFTFIITMKSTNKAFWVHIVNMPGVPWWLKIPVPLLPIIEFSTNMIIRPFVLCIRLFANILAGHINVLSFIILIFVFGAMKPIAGFSFTPFSVAFVVFIYLIEILVAFIQAYVFALLSALYFGMAKEESHH